MSWGSARENDVCPLSVHGASMIVFSQTPEVHEDVEALLSQLRSVRHTPDEIDPDSMKPLWPPIAPEKAAIRRALAKPLTVKCDNVPLEKVAEDLQTKLGIPIRLDVNALRDVEIKTTRPSRSPSPISRRNPRSI